MSFSKITDAINQYYSNIPNNTTIDRLLNTKNENIFGFTLSPHNYVYDLSGSRKRTGRILYKFLSYGHWNSITNSLLAKDLEDPGSNVIIFVDERKLKNKYMQNYKGLDIEKRQKLLEKYPKSFCFILVNERPYLYGPLKTVQYSA